MSPVRPGRLRHRLTLQKKTLDPDGAGGGTEIWTPVASLWAAVEPQGGDDRVLGEGVGGRVTHTITVRHRADVATGDRFTLGTRIFTVRAVHDPDETGAFLVCLADEEG